MSRHFEILRQFSKCEAILTGVLLALTSLFFLAGFSLKTCFHCSRGDVEGNLSTYATVAYLPVCPSQACARGFVPTFPIISHLAEFCVAL